MKPFSTNFTVFLMLAGIFVSCHREPEPASLLTATSWHRTATLHIPDQQGFVILYDSRTYKHFLPDGRFREFETNFGAIEGDWSWIEPEKKLKIDFHGEQPYNQIIEIITLTDTLLHFYQYAEGQSLGSGNYLELQYRPTVTSCEAAVEELNGRVFQSWASLYPGSLDGTATVTPASGQQLAISLATTSLDTTIYLPYSCIMSPESGLIYFNILVPCDFCYLPDASMNIDLFMQGFSFEHNGQTLHFGRKL